MKTKINTKLTLTIAILGFLLILGCKCDNLQKQTWILEQYGHQDSLKNLIIPPPPAKTEIILNLGDNNQFSGNDGCNGIFGKYEGGSHCKIKFLNISSTLMMCYPTTKMAQARAINRIMKNVQAYKQTGDKLILSTKDNEVLRYKKKP